MLPVHLDPIDQNQDPVLEQLIMENLGSCDWTAGSCGAVCVVMMLQEVKLTFSSSLLLLQLFLFLSYLSDAPPGLAF